jgi:hypothetical protein
MTGRQGQTSRRTGRGKQAGGQAGKQAGRQAGRQTGRQAGRQTGIYAERQTDSQTDRQADEHTDRQSMIGRHFTTTPPLKLQSRSIIENLIKYCIPISVCLPCKRKSVDQKKSN